MSSEHSGTCILIAEDEMLMAMMLEDLLDDAGFRVVKAARVPNALELVDTETIDAAILDVNLAGREVFPVADALQARGVPFMFASGYGENCLPEAYRSCAMLQKPYVAEELLQKLDGLLHPA